MNDFERGQEVIIMRYPADTGKPSPVGLRGRVDSVGNADGLKVGRLYTVLMDLRNPDCEHPDDPYVWVFYGDEMDPIESEDDL